MGKRWGFRKICRWFGALTAFVSAAAWSGTARADGGFPRGFGILFEPGNPSHIVVRSQFWGLFDGTLGSPDYHLLCSQVFGGRDTVAENFPTVLAQGGRVLVAADDSFLMVSDDECDWRQKSPFNGEYAIAIAPMDANGESFVALGVLGGASGVTSHVYTSTDRGDTWKQATGAIPKNLSLQGVAVAPSDPTRVYAVGVIAQVGTVADANAGTRQIAVSKDGGATFAILPVGARTDYDPTAYAPLSVAGVVPDDPDTLFVRADGADDPGDMTPDELWVSSDAGQTWKKTFSPMMDLPGFAFTPDGKDVLLAGQQDGILQASLTDAVAAMPGAFTRINSGQVWGLAFQDGKLYAGTDDFNSPHFSVGVSTDGGKTFQQVMSKCNVSNPTCNAGSSMQMMCGDRWTRQGGYLTDIIGLACGGMGGVGGAAGSGGASGNGGVGGSGGTMTSTAGAAATGGTPNDAGVGDIAPRAAAKSSSCSLVAPRRVGVDPTALLVVGAFGVARRRRGESSRRLHRGGRRTPVER
ncbi:MAG TPA: hypothetical protein VHC69_07810 [Polyangiaceae bacterium]|nr:hypothetical protein [Polyangiaceae bacterium]